jgi:UDP-N-acetylmuramoyl-L-alanyl-D-glutamate--2,6-diaminopimelate ligase
LYLRSLVRNLECSIIGDENIEVNGLAYDSRRVKKGDLFFCISGFSTDGHNYAASAVENGAAALMVTRNLDLDVPQILVSDDRKAMADIACEFWGHPSRKLKTVGVTGTNGKTTTTYMCKSIAEKSGKKVGLIGTIVNMIGDRVLETERTTPEAPDLQRLIAEMADEGCDIVVMEVSSHSLDLKRVEGIRYNVGIFTNLTQDHLDYHKTFENYRDAKKILFENADNAVINMDDSYGGYMAEGIGAKVYRCGIRESADLSAKDIEITPAGASFDMAVLKDRIHIDLKIPGLFSVYNSLSAAGAMTALGIPPHFIKEGLETLPSVSGRFEVLDTGNRGYTVILDYAHTPDSLENTLTTVNEFARGRIITVFGCGGDRDRTKRPIMGEIAGRLSNFSIITSDNPRTEIPSEIISQIEEGMKKTGSDYICIENRREAIRYALENARKDDIIVLAGKGHETYQEINKVKYPFDEKIIVREILES